MRLQIPKAVLEKVMYWVEKADFEVSGFGTVIYDSALRTFVVQDACLLKQEGGAAHTDIDAGALGKLMYQVHKQQIPGELKWWWHSHVNMGVFWSGQDLDTIKDLGKNGWITATVFNKREEMKSAFCGVAEVAGIGKTLYLLNDIETEIPDYYNSEETENWDKEFDSNVSRKTFTYTPPSLPGGTQPTLFDKDGEHPKDWQTLKDEADYLGMSLFEYRKVLDYGTFEERKDLMDRLDDYYEMLEEAEMMKAYSGEIPGEAKQ